MLIYVILAVLAGAFIALEASAHGGLRTHLGHPLHAAIVAFTVGLAALVVLSLALTKTLPSISATLAAPRWMLLGGFFGAAFVTLASLATPRTGTLTFVLAALAGQVLVGALLDHLGLLGNAVRPFSLTKFFGLALVFAGVYLVARP